MPPRQLSDAAHADHQELRAAWVAALGLGLGEQARVVHAALQSHPDLECSTVVRVGEILMGFAARQEALGRSRLADTTADDAIGFVWARTRRGNDPSIATVHLRRTALRMLVRAVTELGTPMADPTLGLHLPPRTRSDIRPVDDDELGLLRITATTRTRGRLQSMATLALAESTATTGEITTLTWGEIDLRTGTVQLPGAGRVQPRTGELTRWGTTALERLTAAVPPRDPKPVVYRGRSDPGSQSSQAAIVSRLSRLIGAAGLDDRDLRPNSVRLWKARAALDAGVGIEGAAIMLGNTSLDVTASQLDHRWQP